MQNFPTVILGVRALNLGIIFIHQRTFRCCKRKVSVMYNLCSAFHFLLKLIETLSSVLSCTGASTLHVHFTHSSSISAIFNLASLFGREVSLQIYDRAHCLRLLSSYSFFIRTEKFEFFYVLHNF